MADPSAFRALEQRVDELAEVVEQLRTAHTPSDSDDEDKDATIRRLQYALEKSNAAADALRDAADAEERARALRTEADEHEARAKAALRRAEKAREEATPSP